MAVDFFPFLLHVLMATDSSPQLQDLAGSLVCTKWWLTAHLLSWSYMYTNTVLQWNIWSLEVGLAKFEFSGIPVWLISFGAIFLDQYHLIFFTIFSQKALSKTTSTIKLWFHMCGTVVVRKWQRGQQKLEHRKYKCLIPFMHCGRRTVICSIADFFFCSVERFVPLLCGLRSGKWVWFAFLPKKFSYVGLISTAEGSRDEG